MNDEPENQPPVNEAASPETNKGAGAGKIRGRDIYDKPRLFYAGQYKKTVRAINKWISIGLASSPPDPPPLDDPSALIAWWGRHMKHRVPEEIYTAVPVIANNVPCGTNEPAPAADLFNIPPPVPEITPSSVGRGFLASLLRMREEEAAAHARYKTARETNPPDEGKIRFEFQAWQDIVGRLRSLEKDSAGVLEQSGDMWLAVDIVKELSSIHTAIINGVHSLGRRFAMKTGMQWSVALDRQWQDECDRLFGALLESKFVAANEQPGS